MPLPSHTPKQFEMTCEMKEVKSLGVGSDSDSNVSDWLGEGDSMHPDAWSGTKLPENPMGTAALSGVGLFCDLMFSSAFRQPNPVVVLHFPRLPQLPLAHVFFERLT